MFRSKINKIRVASLFFLLSVLVSSCSTLKDSSEAPDLTMDKTEQSPVNSEIADEGGQPSAASTFQGVDPMADIQINAEIKKAYKDIANLNKSKKYAQALLLLENIKVKYPQLSGPDYQRARIYVNQGQLDNALDAIESSLKNNQRNYFSLNLKGIILREQGQFLLAKETYLNAISI